MKTLLKLIAVFALMETSSVAQSFLTNGLVAYYPFNGNASDATGRGHNGTVVGATLTTNRFGQANSAYNFYGTNIIDIPSAADFNYYPQTGITVSVWAYLTQRLDPEHLVGRRNDAYSSYYQIATGSGGIAGSDLPLGRWTHIVLTITNAIQSFYTNGSLNLSEVFFSSPVTNNVDVYIGGSAQYVRFVGILDDVRFYNRVLSTNEIAQLYLIESGTPVLAAIPNTNINEQILWQYTPTVSGSGYTFGLSNAPSGMALGSNSGTISWTPMEAQGPGTYANITYAVYQSGSTIAWTNFTVTVNEVNVAPVLFVPGTQTNYATTTLTVTNTATDSDIPANTMTFALVSAPSGVNLDANTGVLTWTPTSGQVGTSTITVKVTDNGSPSLSATNSFLVVVKGLTPTTFLQSPVSVVIGVGQSFTFYSLATGFPLPTYQWQFSASGSGYANIAGATGSNYQIGVSGQTNIGFYRVVISNSQGTNTSSAVTLGFIDLKMLASVYLTGPISSVYRIDTASQLAPTNWVTVTNITIPTQPYVYVDYTSATNKMQFYRAVPQ